MSKRYVFAYEGINEIGHYLLPGAVELPEESILVVWQFGFDDSKNILGWAGDFERNEANGELSCSVNWNEEKMALHAKALAEHGDIVASFFLDRLHTRRLLDAEENHIGTEVLSGRLRAISFVVANQFPRPMPREE